MATKVFLTGATGYVGGETLHQIATSTADYKIRSLVRDDQKAKVIKQAYPNVEVVIGDLEDTQLIEQEASAADVVIHLASTRHEVSSRAIIKGLTHGNRNAPGYWLQIGGASMFAGPQVKAGTFGEADAQVWDDVADIAKIRDVIEASPGRVIDNLIISQDPSKLKTAIVPGGIIYGKGSGTGNTRTMQGPAIADYAIKNGQSFQIGKGESQWSYVHVYDVGKLFLLLLKAATEGKTGLWNNEGILFPESGSITWAKFAQLVAESAKEQGLIESTEIKSITAGEADEYMAHGSAILGTNARTKSSRARQKLGWEPSGSTLAEDIPRMVKEEAEILKSQT